MNRTIACLILSAFLLPSFCPGLLAQETSSGAKEQIPADDTEKTTLSGQSGSRLQMMKQEPAFGTYDKPVETAPALPGAKPGKTIVLSGNIEEKNLTVEWNDWHNKFARAVRQRMFSSVFEMINMRQGSTTVYRCEVTADRQIKNVKVVKSSGDFWYDAAVVKAVRSLEGNNLLSFPVQSKRTEIVTEVGIQLGGKRRDELNFGDVEYRELAPGESPPASSATEPQLENPAKSKRNRRHHDAAPEQ